MEQNQSSQQLDTKSEYELKRQKKLEEQKRAQMKRTFKKASKVGLVVLVVAGGIGALVWYSATRPKVPEGEIVSRSGIHWHTKLKIVIKGENIQVPANIGIGMQYAGYPRFDSMMGMTEMHTHDDSGTIHWEVMKGPVTEEDVRLGNFFAIWGKKFDSSCILEYCKGPGGTVKMFVNGAPNTEFQNYPVKDGDTIEIRYE